MQGDSGIVIEDVCEAGMWNLGGRLVLMLMRAGILSGEVVVVAVEVMVVAAIGVMFFFFEKRCLSVTEVEVECLGVSFELVEGDIFDLGGGLVAVLLEMEVDVELEVGVVVRLVCGCLNGRLYMFWRLSRMSLVIFLIACSNFK